MTAGERRGARGRALAFTLIEMTIALSVIGIVAAIGIASVRTSAQSAQQQDQVQQAKDDLLAVRDAAVATIQCRRVEQETPGATNRKLRVFHDVNCTPDVFSDDVQLGMLIYDPASVSSVRVIDNGIFDDEKIQYRTDGSLFDTETTKVKVITVDMVVHELNIQLATGGVIIE